MFPWGTVYEIEVETVGWFLVISLSIFARAGL